MKKKVEIELPPMSAIVNPQEILDVGAVRPLEDFPPIITDHTHPDCALQQNGIDLRLSNVFMAAGATSFFIDKSRDQRCDYHQIYLNNDDTFSFVAGKQYCIDFMEWVEVPQNMMAYIFLRSSVNRYSGMVTTALWDSGFRGRLGGVFRPWVNTRVEYGFRMAQIVFFHADSYRLYEGQYQGQMSQTGQ